MSTPGFLSSSLHHNEIPLPSFEGGSTDCLFPIERKDTWHNAAVSQQAMRPFLSPVGAGIDIRRQSQVTILTLSRLYVLYEKTFVLLVRMHTLS